MKIKAYISGAKKQRQRSPNSRSSGGGRIPFSAIFRIFRFSFSSIAFAISPRVKGICDILTKIAHRQVSKKNKLTPRSIFLGGTETSLCQIPFSLSSPKGIPSGQARPLQSLIVCSREEATEAVEITEIFKRGKNLFNPLVVGERKVLLELWT